MAATLTTAHKDAMRNIWYEVQQDYKTNGVAIYVRLFEKHPNYMAYFKKFEGKTLDQLKDSTILAKHAVLAMKNITELVEKLDDEEALVDVMNNIVDTHYDKKIVYEHYERVFDVILEIFPAALGNLWTDVGQEGWQTAFKVLLVVTKTRLEYLDQQTGTSE